MRLVRAGSSLESGWSFSARQWHRRRTPSNTTRPPITTLETSFEELVDLEIDRSTGPRRTSRRRGSAFVSHDHHRRPDPEVRDRPLADILRGVRGFYVTNDRNYSYLGVRGFSRPGDYNARVLLLVDGHRLNDNIFGSALLGTEFPLDIELIDRVEIIRGPSSSLYGASAFFAVINIITKRPAQQGAGHLLGGRDLRYAAAAGELRSQVHDGRGVLVSASSYHEPGAASPVLPGVRQPRHQQRIRRSCRLRRFHPSLQQGVIREFTVQGLYGSRDKRVPTASFGTVFNDPRSGTVETQGYLDSSTAATLASGWHLVPARLPRSLPVRRRLRVRSVDARLRCRVVNRGLRARRPLGFGSEAHEAVRRAAHARRRRRVPPQFPPESGQLDVEPYMPYFDDRRSSANWAAFVQGELPVGDRVLLNLGLRHDQYDTFGGTTNPRVAAIYTATGTTTLKLFYGQAFRAPNAYEQFWQYPGLAKANPELAARDQPDVRIRARAVLRRPPPHGDRLLLSVKGLITQQTDHRRPAGLQQHRDRRCASGIEFDVERKLRSGLEMRAATRCRTARTGRRRPA